MRLWSLHPKHLDTKGLVALWRESLLAKKVLEGRTKGYTRHPQLGRFKTSGAPLDLINRYLNEVYREALRRGFHFNRRKIDRTFGRRMIPVTTGQRSFETAHLLAKLKKRDPGKYEELRSGKRFELNPVFTIVRGDRESWEKGQSSGRPRR